MVYRGCINRDTGLSPCRIFFGTKYVFKLTGTVPRSIIHQQIPLFVHTKSRELCRKFPKAGSSVSLKTDVLFLKRVDVIDEVWVFNPHQSKLKLKKIGFTVIVAVQPRHTYMSRASAIILSTESNSFITNALAMKRTRSPTHVPNFFHRQE